MTDPIQSNEAEVKDQAEAVALLAAMFAGNGGANLDQVAGPLHWPAVNSDDIPRHWNELRDWVAELMRRFEHLDHHVIPLCWWRHNGHVEALIALRDQERMCYSDTSPPSAAVEWHRAFRDIEARMREWTASLPCGSRHDPRTRPTPAVEEGEWAAFVAQDAARRAAEGSRRKGTGTDTAPSDTGERTDPSEHDR